MRILPFRVSARRDQKVCWSIVRISFANVEIVSNHKVSVKPVQRIATLVTLLPSPARNCSWSIDIIALVRNVRDEFVAQTKPTAILQREP